MFTSIGKTALNRDKIEFERRFMNNTNEQKCQELKCKNGKLTLAIREKGVVFLDLRETLGLSLMDVDDWKEAKEPLGK